MNILFLSMEYPPDTAWGGIGWSVAGIAPALARRGHEVHVLSCVQGQDASDTIDRGVHVHRRGQVRIGIGRTGGMLGMLRSASRLRAALSCRLEIRRLQRRFDVVESPDWMAEGLLVPGTLPLVCHLHTPFALIAELEGLARTADVRLADAMERRAARRSDLVLTASLPLARRLQQTRWWPRDDIEPREMPPAVEPSEWQGRTPVSKTKPLVLAVGRLERVKRPEDLVEAVATLQARIPGIEVALVGRSGLREGRDYGRWLERFARDRGVRCHLTGQASRAEVREWVDRARVVAIPSSFEGLPLFAIEAMTAGRPVICTDQTGVADVVKGSGGGVVVPVGETLELAEALSVYLDDPEEAERAGRRGRDAVASLCAPDTVAQQREAAYRDAIEARRRRSRRYSIPWGRKV